MSDLFNKLKDGASALGKNIPNMPKGMDSKAGMLGAAGVGGLLGAVFGGSKNVKRTAKNVAVVGGSAALAALAYKMYQNWSNGKSSGQGHATAGGYGAPTGGYGSAGGYGASAGNGGYGASAGNGGYGAPAGNGGYGASTGNGGYGAPAGNDPFADFNSQNSQQEMQMLANEGGRLIIEAMIFAARADGHIDAQEQEMIMTAARQMGGDTNNMIREFLSKPLDPRELASKVRNRDQALDIYRLSAAAIVADNNMEMRYLNDLAAALQIDNATRAQLDNDASQLRLQMSGQ